MTELDLLRELAQAVSLLAALDDFGETAVCEACAPENPEEFEAARLRVHALIGEWADRKR